MNVKPLAIDREHARELYQKYKTHQHYETDLDAEVRRTYQLISQGKVIIQAIEAVKAAGVDAKGLPKLALANATAQFCGIAREANGAMRMESVYVTHDKRRRWPKERSKVITDYRAESFVFDPETFPVGRHWQTGKPFRETRTRHRSTVPAIPVHLRPKRGLQNYHVLWEAEWEPIPTRDPYLLRRIGKADLWLVCAAWDLTEVERAAMAARISVS